MANPLGMCTPGVSLKGHQSFWITAHPYDLMAV